MSEQPMQINFEGVGEPAEKVMTPPGTIDVFTIAEVKFGSSKNKGTGYMETTFENANSSFRESFYLTKDALQRVQYLQRQVNNTVFAGQLTGEALVAAFKGKKIALKVFGKIDETKGRVYPSLQFAGFAKPVNRISELAWTPDELNEIKAFKEIRERNAASQADKEEGTSEGQGQQQTDEVF